jgi:intraflagellar transport protein 88
VWYVKNELYEKAIAFFQRAAQIQPHEVKWRLMVTSCYRRMSNYQKALDLYEEIHNDYPDNVECLRYLVALCKDMGLPYDQYQNQLVKLERSVQPTQTGKGMLTQAAPQVAAAAAAAGSSGGSGSGSGNNNNGGGGGGRPQQQALPQHSHLSADERFIEDEERKDTTMDRNAQRKIDHSIGDRGPIIKSKKQEQADEDEWAQADLDDLLAE